MRIGLRKRERNAKDAPAEMRGDWMRIELPFLLAEVWSRPARSLIRDSKGPSLGVIQRTISRWRNPYAEMRGDWMRRELPSSHLLNLGV